MRLWPRRAPTAEASPEALEATYAAMLRAGWTDGLRAWLALDEPTRAVLAASGERVTAERIIALAAALSGPEGLRAVSLAVDGGAEADALGLEDALTKALGRTRRVPA